MADPWAVVSEAPVEVKAQKDPWAVVEEAPVSPVMASVPAHGPAPSLASVPAHAPVPRKNPFLQGPLSPGAVQAPRPAMESAGGGKIGSLTSSQDEDGRLRDLLQAPITLGQDIIHETAELVGNTVRLKNRIVEEHPELIHHLTQVNPVLALGIAGPTKGFRKMEAQVAQDVVEGNRKARASEDAFVKDKLGIDKDTTIGKIAGGVGGVGAGVAKALALGPAALPYFSAEGGINKAVSLLDEGKPLGKALAVGAVSAGTAATLMGIAGKVGGEQVYDSLVKMALRKALTGTEIGLAFGAADLAVDKYMLNKDLTPDEIGGALLQSVKTMLGYELAGGIAEGRLMLEGRGVSREYASPNDARADIAPKLAQAYARGDKAEVNRLYVRMQGVAYADKAGMTFQGGKTHPGASDIPKALAIASASQPQEVKDAHETGQVQEDHPEEHQGGGALGEGQGVVRKPEGTDQETAPVDRGGGAPEGGEVQAGVRLEDLRAQVPEHLRDRFDQDLAAVQNKESEVDSSLKDLDGRRQSVMKKIRNRAYAKFGSKITEKQLQGFMASDPKSVQALQDLSARETFIGVQQDANARARQDLANRWADAAVKGPNEAPVSPLAKSPAPADIEKGASDVATGNREDHGGTEPEVGGTTPGPEPQKPGGPETPAPGEPSGARGVLAQRRGDAIDRLVSGGTPRAPLAAHLTLPKGEKSDHEAQSRIGMGTGVDEPVATPRSGTLPSGNTFESKGNAIHISLPDGGGNLHVSVFPSKGLAAIETIYVDEGRRGTGAAKAMIQDAARLINAAYPEIDRVVGLDLTSEDAHTLMGSYPGTVIKGNTSLTPIGDLAARSGKPRSEPVPARPPELDPTPSHEVPDSLLDVPGLKVSGDVFTIPIESLHADPARFQHKVQNEATGVQQVNPKTGASGSLHGVTTWNDRSAGVLDVWRDPEDGKVYVVNGHNRYDKALELGVKNLKVRFLDAKDANEALIFGARANLAEGNGTALDAAVYFRNTKSTPEDLKAQGIPVNKRIVSDGMALASLPDSWFYAAANDPDVMRLAIETGKAGLKGKQADLAFEELHRQLAKKGGDASEISSSYWGDMVDRIKGTRDISTGETNLFGEEDTVNTLPQQTDLIRHIKSKLGAEKQVGNVLTGKRYASAVGKAATVEQGAAGTLKQESTDALNHFNQQKNLTGIGDIINDYAERLYHARSPKDAERIRGEALEAVRKQVQADLQGGGRPGEPGGQGGAEGGPGLPGIEEPEVAPKSPREQAKDKVREMLPGDGNKAARAAVYASGSVTPESTPEDVAAAAVMPSPDMKDPERGAVNLPANLDTGKVLRTIAERVGEGIKGFLSKRTAAARKESALLNLANAKAKLGQLQMPFRKGRPMPAVSRSMVAGEKPVLAKDSNVGQVGQHFRSPHYLGEGEGAYTDDKILAENHEASYLGTYEPAVKDIFKRHGVDDHSEKVDKVMGPLQEKIYAVDSKLAPRVAERRDLQAAVLRQRRRAVKIETDKAEASLIKRTLAKGGEGDLRGKAKLSEDQLRDVLDRAETDKGVQQAKRTLAQFDQEHQADMERMIEEKDGLYAQATKAIRDLAKDSPDVRVALYMEPEGKRPPWLKGMIKENEVRAAEELTALNKQFRDLGKDLGLNMRDEEYITHLLNPGEAYISETSAETKEKARAVLNFHQRQEGSINLMPSAHAAMSYYIPTIARKLARQPVLNKWYANGKNDYLDPNSRYYAKNFGQWLDRDLKEWQYPVHPDVVDRGLGWAKQIEMTRLLGANPRVGIKHAVSKLANNLAIHRTYMLGGMKDYVVNVARRAENMPLIGEAFKATTGKVLNWADMSESDSDKVQALMSSLVQRRQIMMALNEDPLIAKYQKPLFNAFFGRGVRGAAETAFKAGRKVQSALGQPVSMVEAMENFVNAAASIRKGEAAGLSHDDQIRGVIKNLLDISQRGGADSSRFLKSKVGKLTALTQTPSKMYEFYADTLRRGLKGEKDIYGTSGTTDLLALIAVHGAIIAMGQKAGKMAGGAGLRLWRMLYHPPAADPEVASKYARYAWNAIHSDPEHQREAMRLKMSGDGDIRNLINATPFGTMGQDVATLFSAPEALVKGTPAYQQWRALVGGKRPQGYESRLHYLFGSQSEEQEKRMESLNTLKGKQKYLKLQRQANK